ncbi:hypothetical protein [Rhodanobacter sp. FW106-PBR-R2A-1-13]|uniref:hypothetical protein n=1 Tax=Rhodanobacter sp. FW106-PBR-R2A-1-13 TaxID=3454845 RepID=UPI0034E3B476
MQSNIERMGNVLSQLGRPGTCEAAIAILKGMPAREQADVAVKFPTQMRGLTLQYPRFAEEAPIAAQAAEDALALGL